MSGEEEKNYVYNKDIEFAPLRPLKEYILDTERFELPTFNDPPRWNKRLVSNLLYFQSNYFITFFIFFLICSAFNARSFTIGGMILLLFAALGMVIFSKDNGIVTMRTEHPYAFLVAILITSYLGITYLSELFFSMFVFCLPLSLILIHASTRLRGIKNKVNQSVEGIVRKTVMASILRTLGIDYIRT